MKSKHSFVVGIARLRKEPGSVMNFDLEGVIEDLRFSSSYVEEGEVIHVRGSAESVHGGILVSGEIGTRWKAECRRCLGSAMGELRIEFRELYERAEHGSELPFEGDTYPYSGDVIDFRDMLKDQVLLELPLAPLCRDDCKGLCSSCGADLNLGECRCDNVPVDPRWGALDVLVEKRR